MIPKLHRFFVAAAAAGLLVAAPALAADQHHDNQRHVARHTTVHRSTVNRNGHHATRTVRTTHVNVIRGNHHANRTVRHVTVTRGGRGHRVTTHRTVVTHHTANRNDHRYDHRGGNYHAYRRNVRAAHRYHWGSYHRPHGWYAHRWVYGERLPHGWYGRDYWIGDFGNFGLIAPPPGFVWVRVGDDALLVNLETGVVLQVEYDIFY